MPGILASSMSGPNRWISRWSREAQGSRATPTRARGEEGRRGRHAHEMAIGRWNACNDRSMPLRDRAWARPRDLPPVGYLDALIEREPPIGRVLRLIHEDEDS